jgi:hypothetical protein
MVLLMKRFRTLGLLLAGVGLGVVATVVAPVAKSYAQGGGATWDCFVVDRLPDVQGARGWEPAANVTAGLNHAAPDAARGTMITVDPKGNRTASVACIKH